MSWARLSPAEREKLACAMKMDFGRPVTAYLTNAMFVAVDELMHKAMGMMNGELNAQYSNFTEGSARRNFQELRSLISIVLYLCSSEPDIDPARMPNSTTRELPFRKGKKGNYLFTPDKPRVFRVGGTLGEKLRGAAVQATRKTVKTHLRRAHWHGF